MSDAPEVDAAALYDAMADAYAAEEGNPFNSLYERPAMLDLLGDVAGRRVLDAGCGTGSLAAALVERDARVTGIDASAAMLAHAEARVGDRATFAVGDLRAPLGGLADAPFDRVALSLVLHYLHDWVGPLRELRRVLAPDGWIVASTHHPALTAALWPDLNPFATELLTDRWEKGGRTWDVRFWQRPLGAMVDACGEAGLRVRRLVEPRPLPECEALHPEAWARLTTQPWFLFLVLERASPDR